MGAFDGPDDLSRRLREVERRLAALESPAVGRNYGFGVDGIEFRDGGGETVIRLGTQDNAIPYGLEILGASVDAVSAAQDDDVFLNAAVNTTEQTLLSASLPVPDWANTALVFANASFQITNGSGGFQTMVVGIDIDGVPGTGGLSKSTSNGFTEPVTNHRGQIVTNPGATISVGARCWVLSGTNNANLGRLTAIGVFLRA